MMHIHSVDLSSWFVLAFMLFSFSSGAYSSLLEWLDSEDRNTKDNIGRLHSLGEMAKKLFTKRKIEQAASYKTISGRFSSFSDAVDSGLATLVMLFGVLPTMIAWLHGTFPQLDMVWCWIAASSALTTFVTLVHAPFEWYSTFSIDSKFGLSTTSARTFVLDRLKSIVVAPILSAMTALPLDWALREYLGSGDVANTVYFFAAYILAVTFISPAVGWLMMHLFYKLKPLGKSALRRRLEALCGRCGMKTPGIYVVDDSTRNTQANAFITGVLFWKKIVLSDNLIANHTTDEIEAVMAHEIGHGKLHHLMFGNIMSVVTWTCGLLVTLVLIKTEAFYHAFGYTWVTHENMAENYIMGFFLAASFKTAFTWVLSPFEAWMSRTMEYAADRFAVEHIKSRTSLVNALLRLYSENLSDLFPHPLYEKTTYSHPSILKRIEALPARPRRRRASKNVKTKSL